MCTTKCQTRSEIFCGPGLNHKSGHKHVWLQSPQGMAEWDSPSLRRTRVNFSPVPSFRSTVPEFGCLSAYTLYAQPKKRFKKTVTLKAIWRIVEPERGVTIAYNYYRIFLRTNSAWVALIRNDVSKVAAYRGGEVVMTKY